MENQDNGKRSRVIIILLLLLLIVAAWLLYNEKNTAANLTSDKKELEQDLAEMVAQYDIVLGDKDSLNLELIEERNRILDLRDSVSMLTDNVRLLERYRSEVRRIRRERADLLELADSLRAMAVYYQQESELITDTLQAERMVNEQLSETNEKLETTIKKGAILEAQGIIAQGIKIRSNGSEKVMDKATRVDKFKTCFTLGKNLLSEKGNKMVYLRLVNPNGMVEQGALTSSMTMAAADDKTIEVSERKQVYYEGSPIDMCIYVDAPEEPMVGTYTVEVYCEGHLIGQSSFKLEDSIF